MNFDPDAYLASKAAPKVDTAPLGNGNTPAFDPDAYLASKKAPAPDYASKPDEGAAYAGLQGGLQGATFGFWDELSAGLRSLAETKDFSSIPAAYRKNVAAEREDLHTSEHQHPIASTLGQVAGGAATALIPGAGLASLGKGFAANAARGAGAGILAGAGASEADSIPGVVSDAAKGGLIGGATGGFLGTAAEKLTEGAPQRVANRAVNDVTGGRATRAGKAVYRNEDLVSETAAKFGIDGRAPDALEKVRAAMQPVGEQLGALRQQIGADTLGVSRQEINRAIGSVQAELSAPSQQPLKRALSRWKDDVETAWGDAKRVSVGDLNREVGKLENTGFAGDQLHPSDAKLLQRNLAGALEDVMQSRLEEVRTLGKQVANSSLGKREAFAPLAGAAQAADKIPELNRDYRGLKLIAQALDDRSALPEASKAAGGLRDALGKTLDYGLAFTHPVAFAAKKAAEYGAPAVARASDTALSALIAARANGSLTSAMILQAIQQGVPRGVAETFASGLTGP